MLQVVVQGGTNAGCRVLKQAKRKDWICPDCGHGPIPYYWLNCPRCGADRPEE